MTYPQALNYLNSFINYERLNSYPYQSCFRLARMQKLLHLLGNPQQTFRSIHVAGTKGKGSTCAFVANILKAAGFKTGLYTSPHLVDLRERIRILQSTENRVQSTEKDRISRRDFARIAGKIKPQAEKLRATNLGQLSYFEVLTALAFFYFREQKAKFAVLETGIGGRLDATNVVSSLVCAITPISYEHTEVLGRTLSRIAAEKAAIIKDKRQIVVTAPQRPAVLKIIKRQASRVGADLYELGKDIQIKKKSTILSRRLFAVQGILAEYSGLKIGLWGEHQVVNAAVALACVEALGLQGIKVSPEAIRKGLKNTLWPGRLQIVSRRPQVVLDAAHCRVSAQALKDALVRLFKFRKLILVFGVSKGKDVRGILRELTPLAARVILTRSQNPRALSPEMIKTFIQTNKRPIILTESPDQALKVAGRDAGPKDLILVCGSLFLVGEVLKDNFLPIQ